MSDDVRLALANLNEPPKRMDEHWCEHPGCKNWGSFGYHRRIAFDGCLTSTGSMDRVGED